MNDISPAIAAIRAARVAREAAALSAPRIGRNAFFVQHLLVGAKGDLHQDEDANFYYMAWEYRYGQSDAAKEVRGYVHPILINVTKEGLFLTREGARFILENCPPEANLPGARGDIIALSRFAFGK
jgi:hypothetical protein